MVWLKPVWMSTLVVYRSDDQACRERGLVLGGISLLRDAIGEQLAGYTALQGGVGWDGVDA